MTVTTPGEKGFERKTPIGRVFTKAEILGGGKRRKEGGGGGWLDKETSRPLRSSSSGRSGGNVVERNKDTPSPPCGGVVAARKSARKETLNWKSFGRAVSGQSCRMLKNKRATLLLPSPPLPPGHYPRRNRFKFFTRIIFLTVHPLRDSLRDFERFGSEF